MNSTYIHAHRGASAYHPENTLMAFELAIKRGVDYIELDVHLTKDGKIVVANDSKIERVSTGTGYINNHTLSELKKLNFNTIFFEQPECTIPTLEEVYELVKNTSVKLNIDLKTSEFPYIDMPNKLITLERKYSMRSRVMYSSSNYFSLKTLREIEPKAKICVIDKLGLLKPCTCANYLCADLICLRYSNILANSKLVSLFHNEGVKVNVGTIDDAEIITQMIKYKVDGIITNVLDIAIKCREKALNSSFK